MEIKHKRPECWHIFPGNRVGSAFLAFLTPFLLASLVSAPRTTTVTESTVRQLLVPQVEVPELSAFVDLAAPEVIKFGIESKFSCPETSTEEFKNAISSALLDMRTLILDVDAVLHVTQFDAPRPRL